jgi:hypothetical protein
MKLVLIAYNEAIDEEVQELLERNGVVGFTKWTRVYGRGQASEPHLGTHVWPKANNVLLIVTEGPIAQRLLEGVRALRQRLAREGIKAFAWEVQEIT